MYPSHIVDATDPDLFVASVRPAAMDFVVSERGWFSARSTLFDLGRVYAQRCRETLRRVKHADVPRGGVMFLTAPGPGMVISGAELGMNQIAVIDAGESYTSRLLGPTQWGAVTLTQEDMDAIRTPEADRCIRPLSGMTVFAPLPAALGRLRSLHGYMGHLAETTPKSLYNTRLPTTSNITFLRPCGTFSAHGRRGSIPSAGTAIKSSSTDSVPCSKRRMIYQ